MLKLKWQIIPIMVTVLWMVSCVEEFDARFALSNQIVIIDGSLTDVPGNNYVRLRLSKPSGKSSYFFDIKDADVIVLKDGTEPVNLTYTKDGYYFLPATYKAEPDHTYQLKIKMADGSNYQTDPQLMKSVPPISKVYQRFQEDLIKTATGSMAGHKIFLDTQDPAGKGDAYYWTWRLFEYQNYCISCNGGRYYKNESGGSCVGDQLLARYDVTFDYQCETPCWDIIYSSKLNAMIDTYTDGKTITAREIADIPVYTRKGAVIEITQHAINSDAYRYIKLLIDQNQNSGSLADTPSSALQGNLYSLTNQNDVLGGYFIVSSVNTVSYFLDRSDVSSSTRPFGLFNGRQENPEPSTADTTRPPLAPCKESRDRTQLSPENWQY